MSMVSTMLSIAWSRELHGTVITIIAVGTLCGSVYLLLGTNLGARLGLLVALAGLFGWMSIMGTVWWAYGIGLKGAAPSWNQTGVIVNDADLSSLGIGPSSGLSDDPPTRSDQNKQILIDDGWTLLAEDDPKRALAIAGADEIIQQEAELLTASQYVSVNVFDQGGERFPTFFDDKIDFFGFFHTPHYAIVEQAVVKPVYAEPGRAPRTPEIDQSIPHKYVKMVRDRGSLRKNAAIIAIFSGLAFASLCWIMHRRDRVVTANRAQE